MNNYNFKKDSDFQVCSGHKDLKYGRSAKIDMLVYLKDGSSTENIKALLEKDDLENQLEDYKVEEKKVFDEIYQSMERWVEKAKQTRICMIALKYKKKSEDMANRQHTNNKWIFIDKQNNAMKISNMVYEMYFSIYTDTKYNKKTKEYDPIAYYVTWYILVKGIGNNNKQIAGQSRKIYTDKEKALKYIEGRKKAYSHYFKEISPAVPEEYKYLFEVHGVLLPGYKIEK